MRDAQIIRHPFLTNISRKLGVSMTILWGRWGLPIPMPCKVRNVGKYPNRVTEHGARRDLR